MSTPILGPQTRINPFALKLTQLTMNSPLDSPRFYSQESIRATLRSLWLYRRFILGSVAREFRSRYANTLLGALWLVFSPFAMILVYTVVFSQIMHARLAGSAEPFAYSIYLCAGLLPWQWMTELLSRNVGIFVDHGGLIKKSNFPRLALPVISFIASACNFALVFGLFLIFLVFLGRWPGWSIFALLPLFHAYLLRLALRSHKHGRRRIDR